MEKAIDENKAKLGKNTIIYFIGNFGSKILSLILVPIYSRYISPEPLGIYDLLITSAALLQPIILFQLSDGIFRWLISEKNNDAKYIYIKTVSQVVLLNNVLAFVIAFTVSIFIKIPYFWYIACFVVINSIYPFIQQITRGLGKNKLYSFVGLSVSICLFVFAILFVVVFGMTVDGLLLAQILSESTGIIILIVAQFKVFKLSIKAGAEKRFRGEVLRYSMPLIPNTISWWIISASDRYVVTATLGTYHNGILSMATKFPTMMTVVTSIFNLAWQESAILTNESKNKAEFYTEIFNNYVRFLFSAAIVLIPLTKIIVVWLVDPSYSESWHYSSILYVAAIFSALSSFLGAAYLSSKKTKGSLVTTIVCAAINLLVDIALIRFIGLFAAVVSTFVSYFALFVIRLFHTKRYFKIKLDVFSFVISAFVLGLSFLFTEICSASQCVAIVAVGLLLALAFNSAFLKDFYKIYLKKNRTQPVNPRKSK